jgi:hypothetical protein
MKVNLYIPPQTETEGCLNINLAGDKGIDEFVDDAEADEIFAIDVLSTYHFSKMNNVLGKWVSKLAHGGKITVGFIDLMFVAKTIHNRTMSILKANELLYGDGLKGSAFSLEMIKIALEEKGIKILTCRSENGYAVIVGERP